MSSIDDAFAFYLRHVFDDEKITLLRNNNLKIAGSVPSVIWELFGAILTGRSGAGITGADLIGWEVKSAKIGGSFEYQYHLNTGGEKLREDCKVNHLFCTYSDTYKDVVVRTMTGNELAQQFFMKWEPEYKANYDATAHASARRQRFRKNIPFTYVQLNGRVVMKIKDGTLIERNDRLLNDLNGN